MKKLEWTEIDFLCDELAQQIKECETKFDAIYGVPRGGLIPATILSHKLGIPLITGDPVFEAKESKNILLVDDINDTGVTLEAYVGCENIQSAVLYERAESDIRSEFVGDVIHHNGWIVFPWEVVENATEDMANYLERRHGSVV